MTKHAQCSSQPSFNRGDSSVLHHGACRQKPPVSRCNHGNQKKSSLYLWQRNESKGMGHIQLLPAAPSMPSKGCALPVVMLEVESREDTS